MELKAARVESFDASNGEGVLRLDEDGGAVPVHFALDTCRGIVPKPGARVLAGQLGPEPGCGGPLSETFALRAGLVEPDVGAGSIETIQTIGIAAPKQGKNWTGKPVMRVPFDGSAFPGLRAAFPEEVVAMLTIGLPAPLTASGLPDYMRGLSGLCSISRRAHRYRLAPGEVPVGGTFTGGAWADIGDTPWPTGTAGPMYPVLQIGLNDARKIGLEQQVNVFFNPAEPPEHAIPSLVPGFIRQQVVSEFSNFHLLTCRPGKRVSVVGAIGEAVPLALVDEVAVFPDIIGLQSAYASLGQELPLDVTRFWDVQIENGNDYRSIQAEIAKCFPTVADFDGDVILGGFSSLRVRDGAPFKRLATFSTTSFDWLRSLVEDWGKAALEVSLDGPSARAWLHGTN